MTNKSMAKRVADRHIRQATVYNRMRPTDPAMYRVTRKGPYWPYVLKARGPNNRWSIYFEREDLDFIKEWFKAEGIDPRKVTLVDKENPRQKTVVARAKRRKKPQPMKTRMRAGKESKLLPTLWVVMDPTPDSLLIDILWKTTTDRLPEYILGSGAARWRKEHAALHDDEQSAKKDALARLRKIHGRKRLARVVVANLIQRPRKVGFDSLPAETKNDILHNLIELVPDLRGYDSYDVKDLLYGHDDELLRGMAKTKEVSRAARNRGTSDRAVEKLRDILQGRSSKFNLDPVIVAGNKFVDGGHRTEAYAQEGREWIPVVDITPLFDLPWKGWVEESGFQKLAGYKGNPDGKDIYPNEINHGARGEPLAGGTDVMRRLQNELLHEQGNDDWKRPESPKVASLPDDFDEAEAYLNENLVNFPKKSDWWLPAHNLGVNMTLMGKINLWVYSIFPTAAMVKGLDAAFRPEGVDPVTEPAGLVIRPMWVPHPKYRKEFPVTLKTVELLVQMAQQAVTVGETAQRQLKQIEAHAGITIPTGIKAKVIREAPQIAARRWGVNRLRVKSTFIPLDGRKPIPMPS